jgi:hypothetical protein
MIEDLRLPSASSWRFIPPAGLRRGLLILDSRTTGISAEQKKIMFEALKRWPVKMAFRAVRLPQWRTPPELCDEWP